MYKSREPIKFFDRLLSSVTQNLSDGLRATVMSTVGCKFLFLELQTLFRRHLVGAMFYVSPTLTMLMLAVVPPVSLGAVRCIYFIILSTTSF